MGWQIDPLGFAPLLPATTTTGVCRCSRIENGIGVIESGRVKRRADDYRIGLSSRPYQRHERGDI